MPNFPTAFRSLLMLACAAFVAVTLSAPVRADQARILVIGDSMFASNGVTGRSVPRVLEQVLGQRVDSRATLGARMIYSLPISGAAGLSIPKQLGRGNHDWVVINGGGNDLWFGCGCNKCDRTLERLISADGTRGEIPRLVARVQATGAKILWVGYLRSPGFDSPIEHCRDDGDVLEARIAKLAARARNMEFVSLADLVPEGDTSLHARDHVHPSVKGSRAIAARIVAAMRQH